jgi:hypothetical protein
MMTSGTEMPNQRSTSVNMVVNGTALEDLSLQRIAFRTKNMTKTTPGNITAILMVIFFHLKLGR